MSRIAARKQGQGSAFCRGGVEARFALPPRGRFFFYWPENWPISPRAVSSEADQARTAHVAAISAARMAESALARSAMRSSGSSADMQADESAGERKTISLLAISASCLEEHRDAEPKETGAEQPRQQSELPVHGRLRSGQGRSFKVARRYIFLYTAMATSAVLPATPPGGMRNNSINPGSRRAPIRDALRFSAGRGRAQSSCKGVRFPQARLGPDKIGTRIPEPRAPCPC